MKTKINANKQNEHILFSFYFHFIFLLPSVFQKLSLKLLASLRTAPTSSPVFLDQKMGNRKEPWKLGWDSTFLIFLFPFHFIFIFFITVFLIIFNYFLFFIFYYSTLFMIQEFLPCSLLLLDILHEVKNI